MARRRDDEAIGVGFPVFLADGGSSFGAVRILGRDLVVNVENAGDFRVPIEAIVKVVNKRVVLDWGFLPSGMQEAIKHALDREDYPPREEDPEARVLDDEDARPQDRRRGSGPHDELPGRDVGSRYGAPPSVTTPRRPR